MRGIVWSDDALDDFDTAIFHIVLDSKKSAGLVADRIEAAVSLLADMPIGRPGRVKGTYEKVVGRTSYIIAYTISDTTLTVARVIHGNRDWPADSWPSDG